MTYYLPVNPGFGSRPDVDYRHKRYYIIWEPDTRLSICRCQGGDWIFIGGV